MTRFISLSLALSISHLIFPAFGGRTIPGINVNETDESWKCACKTTTGNTIVYNSQSLCEQVIQFQAIDESNGKTCITHDQVLLSCKLQMRQWWSETISPNRTPLPTAVHELRRMLRNRAFIPRLHSAYANRTRINPMSFAEWAAPQCSEVAFQKFTGKKGFTEDWGRGILTDVFGTYPLKHEDILQYRDWSETLNVGGLGAVQEHTIFKKIRKFFGISDNFLLNANFSDVNTDINAGSGSIFVNYDPFMIKGERASDWHSQVDWVSFFDFVEDYANYIMTQKDTLLPRFFSAFYDSQNQIYYFVMQNWIPSTWTMSVRNYDFKGSRIPVKRGDTNSRMVEITESTTNNQISRQVLKDLNFLGEKIHVSPNVRDRLVEQLAADTRWLAEHNLMDYSLMLQVIHVGKNDKQSLEKVCKAGPRNPLHVGISQLYHGFLVGVTPTDSTMYIYAMGLIDILQPYSVFKAVGTAYDYVKFPQQTGELAMNNIPPREYQKRFERFFDHMIVDDAEPPKCGPAIGNKTLDRFRAN